MSVNLFFYGTVEYTNDRGAHGLVILGFIPVFKISSLLEIDVSNRAFVFGSEG